MNGGRIVLFDGVCNLCESSIQFLIRHDRHQQLKYTSLQSEAAAHLLSAHELDEKYLKSIAFVDEGKIYLESDAALRICRYLTGPYKYLYYLRFIPRSIRNIFYHWIARNRYKWFGKKDQCMVPDESVKERFLDTWPV